MSTKRGLWIGRNSKVYSNVMSVFDAATWGVLGG